MTILHTCTEDANDNLWLTGAIATGMNTHGCDTPNGSKFALFWVIRDVVGPHGCNMKNWRFVVVVILEIKATIFTCLLFPKHLDARLGTGT